MVWPLILGAALVVGGAAAQAKGARDAGRAQKKVLDRENRRQAQFDQQYAAKTDAAVAQSSPVAVLPQESNDAQANAAELATLGQQVQAGSGMAGGLTLTPGQGQRVSNAARALAQLRATQKGSDTVRTLASQLAIDRNRLAQKAARSKEITGLEAGDAANAGSNARMLGGVAQGGGGIIAGLGGGSTAKKSERV